MANLDARARRWRRLLWPGLLALGIHVLVLLVVQPPTPPQESSILRPLIYHTPPEPPAQAAATPAPQRTARRPRPRPAPSGPAAPLVAPEPPPATPASPAPAPPEAVPAPEVATAPPPPPVAVAASPAPAPPPAALVPGSLRLQYTLEGEISRLAYHASGELLWKHDGQHYELRLEVGAFLLGSRVQSSRGRLAPAGLQPLRFVDRVRNDRVAEFDYEQQQIRFSDGPAPVPLPPEAQDQLSIFVQLGSLIAAAPHRYVPGSEVTLPAIGVYGPESWRLVVGTQEQLSLPGGEQRALKLTREPARADEPRAEIWLAPAQGWLPVRIRLSQPNGDFIDQLWRGSETP